jgi:hypothetical protein
MTPDPALLARIAASLQADLRPVHRMPPVWALAAALFTIFAAVATGGAGLIGFFGLHRLSADAIPAIFPPLAALGLLAARAGAGAVSPGSKHPFHPTALLVAAYAVLALVFVSVFHDYRTDSFVQQGIPCLKAGLLWAIPAAVGAWLVLRRGFAVDRTAAGIAVGTLAGLTGVTVLELHCPNLRMPHIVVWHLAVLPVAALSGRGLLYTYPSPRDT